MKRKPMTNSLQTVSRAVALLRCFEGGARTLSLGQLTQIMGLNKVNVLRLAQSLTEEGLLDKNPKDGRYSISYGVLALARQLFNPDDLIARAMPILERAQAATQETVTLNLREGTEAVIIHEIVSHKPIKYSLGVGYRADLRLGGVGLAILSALGDEEVARVLSTRAPKFASGGAATRSFIEEELAVVRTNGCAETTGQRELDATGHAAPFTGPDGNVLGAVGVLLPSSRNRDEVHRQRCRKAVLEAGRALTALLASGRASEISTQEGAS
ncbi:transcriptional regulator, IclR family [Nitratireductor indicus]|nr:transcriptional regulator, IclR family [Nitratireductor indicus]